ncbi:MAG: ABC transporter substrate-binding protein, partial [Terriglobales bacterium]
MKRTAFRWLAVSALLLSGAIAFAEDRPRYGGTLRVQLRDAVFSLDPKDAADLTGVRHRFAFLLYDRLTRIDDQGRVRPQLAVSWSSDAQRKMWRFTLRSGVVFHDGSPLTVATVISNFANDAR